MKQLKRLFFIFLVLLFIFGCSGSSDISNEKVTGKAEKEYYGVEVNGVLCGYSELTVNHIEKDGKKVKQVEQNIFFMLTLLGSNVNTDMKMLSYLDPETDKCNYFSIDVTQGDIKRKAKIVIKDNTAIIESFMSQEPTKIKMTPDIIFGDYELVKNLKKDFSDGSTKEKSYNILEPMDGKIRKTTFTKLGTEKIKLAGKTYHAVVFNQLTKETGIKMKWWFDLENSDMLKFEVSNRKIFKTDHKVVDKIKVANMDESIFTKSDVSIADIHAISYMKLKVQIEPTGVQLTAEGLNIPGQRFTGTVKENLIEGILEIEHKKYNGEDAPAFPPDYSNDESLQKYLQPEKMIESDDPVLIEKAKEITGGSQDSWEAARRLSKWVAEKITYGIPGGITARKTYDMKAGECGAHSCLLAAFCRAVGIPARVVWGAMYAPNYGGGFGQHGWNEIYMGKAGWIPVDATAFEEDFLDSGHIRIAELQSTSTAFNGKKIEVLDYRVGTTKMGKAIETGAEEFKKYIGKYKNTATKKVIIVKVQDRGLVVDIPGRAVLPLDKPDKNGFLYCKIAKHIYFTFKENDSGKMTDMHLHQILDVQKKSGLTEVNDNVPEKFKPYLGEYYLAAANLNIKVLYKDGTLAVDAPIEEDLIKLHTTDEKNKWIDQYNKNYISFEFDDKGNVIGMKVDIVDKFKRS